MRNLFYVSSLLHGHRFGLLPSSLLLHLPAQQLCCSFSSSSSSSSSSSRRRTTRPSLSLPGLPEGYKLTEDWKPPPGFKNYGDDDELPLPPLDGSGDGDDIESYGDEDEDDSMLSAGFEDRPPQRRSAAPRREPAADTFAAMLEVPRGVCVGCGARFQTEDEAAPGFTPAHVLEERMATRESGPKRMAVCQRCHGLRYQNRLPVDALRVGADATTHAELQPEHFIGLLRTIAKQRCVVIAIVDLFDFHGSLVPNLSLVVGNNPLILVGNKFDLLPTGVDAKSVERWVRSEARKASVPAPASVHLVSCKTGVGMPKLLEELQFTMTSKRLDAYVVGAANAGKSSFINHVIKGSGPRGSGRGVGRDDDFSLTTSPLPGTTLDFVRVSVFAGRHSLYDSPGVILPNQLTTRLTTDELSQIVPKKRAQHVTLRVAEGKSVLLGGIARLHMRAGRPFFFTFYLANAVAIHPTDTSKVDEMLQKHVGGLLAPPASYERLAELGAFEEHTFQIEGRGWDEAAVDLVLPGLGWIAVTGAGACTVDIALPTPTRAIVREPLISSEGGKGVRKSVVKFSGSKLRDKRGNTKRIR